MLFGMMDLPMPVSKNAYTTHNQESEKQAKLQAEDSMARAREEVRRLYDSEYDGDVVDVLVSCDGTWQQRGFSSLFGAVFIIAYETGKVIGFTVKSKFCKGCRHWEKMDKNLEAYVSCNESHASVCDANYSGSAGSMEPQGTLEMFQSSVKHGLRYKWWGHTDTFTPPAGTTVWERPYRGEDRLCWTCAKANGNCSAQSQDPIQRAEAGEWEDYWWCWVANRQSYKFPSKLLWGRNT
jgi:hypothetical protein